MKAKRISIYLLFILIMLANKTALSQVGGNGLWLDGVNDYMAVPYSSSLDITGDQITIEAWIKVTGGSGYRTIVRTTTGWGGPLAGYYFRLEPGGNLFFSLIDASGWGVVGSTILNLNQWYHVAGVYDGNSLKIYLNGALDGAESGFGNIISSPYGLHVGTIAESGAEYFTGIIDELRISDIARYTSDFEPPTDPLITDVNTAALYHFDETGGSTASDASANGNNGTLYNGAYFDSVTSDDVIPPSAINDLTIEDVSFTSVTLTWTSPGDDGEKGIANTYDVRYSTSPITDENWATASKASGEPPPDSAGTTQLFQVTGLSGGKDYYFALKTSDEVPNWSEISNVVQATTLGGTEVGGLISGNTTWTLAGSPYIVISDIQVVSTSNPTLTIEPGVTVLFSENTTLSFGGNTYSNVRGNLMAVGTESDSIMFTSLNGETNGWKGIYLATFSSCTCDYCVIENAGQSNGANIVSVSEQGVVISHSTIRNATGSGVLIQRNGMQITDCTINSNSVDGIIISYCSATITGCRFENNGVYPMHYNAAYFLNNSNNTYSGNGNEAIGIEGGTIAASGTWRYDGGEPYHVISDIQVVSTSNPTLTIEPGVTVLFSENTTLSFGGNTYSNVRGNLMAVGTESDSIMFTSLNGETNGWKGIYLATFSSCTCDYCVIENAGQSNGANIYINYSNNCNLMNSIIRNSGSSGIKINNGSPIINYCDLYDNATYEIENIGTTSIDAQYNYWGPITTWEIAKGDNPKDIEKIYDIFDNSSCGTIDYSNWISKGWENLMIDPNEGGNSGIITVMIGGSGFLPGAGALLLREGEPEIINIDIAFVDSTIILSSFDLNGASVGLWDVMVVNPDNRTYLLENGFSVIEASYFHYLEDDVKTDIIGRNTILLGRQQTCTIHFTNKGSNNVGAPILTLSSDDDVNFSLRYEYLYHNSPLKIFAAGGLGWGGRLIPGFSNSTGVLVRANSGSGNITLNLCIVDIEGQPFDWDRLASDGVPQGLPAEDWSTIIELARSRIGEYWDDVMAIIRTECDNGQQDNDLFCFDKLIEFVVTVYGSNIDDFNKGSNNTFSKILPFKKRYDRRVTKLDGFILPDIDKSQVKVDTVGSWNQNPTHNFVITHGMGGTEDGDRFHQLAIEIKTLFPNANVYLVDWTPGAKKSTLGIPDPWKAAPNIDLAGEAAFDQLNEYGVKPLNSTFIGESFGNYVNNVIAEKFGKVDKILAFNPANELTQVNAPSFTNFCIESWSFHTCSPWDTNLKRAHFSMFLDTREGAGATDQHTWGIRWLIEQLREGDDSWLLLNQIPIKASTGYYDGTARLDRSYDSTPVLIPFYFYPGYLLPNPILTGQLLMSVVQSFDPNEKVTSQGVAEEKYVSIDEPLKYSIYFENVDTATAPAQEVIITDSLDMDKMNLSNLYLENIVFGNNHVNVPDHLSEFSTEVDLRPESDLLVKIEITLNEDNGLLSWHFTSIDPVTGTIPEDPMIGFLPPNINPPEGEGSVVFTIMPMQELISGNQILNRASIEFDLNPLINTNETFSTIDAEKPTSNITAYSPSPKPPQFEIHWTGTDEPNGSGVKSYNVYFAEDGGPYDPWLRDTTATSAIFTIEQCRSYAFYSTARDSVGHIEPMPMEPDTILPPMAIYQFGDMGWYLHSLPVTVENDSSKHIFPNSLAAMGWDTYNQKYDDAAKMSIGQGYWLAIPQPDSIATIGTPVQSVTRHFQQGWHLIGSVKDMVNFSNPNDNPDGAVLGAFSWDTQNRSYYETDTLITNQGYWIAVLEECDLTVGGELPSGKLTKSKASVTEFYEKYGHQPPPPPSYIFGDGKLVEIPRTYKLYQNYPNPFNAQTVIKYQLPEGGKVSLKIYNILGQEVKTLVDEEKQAGYHKAIWDGLNNHGIMIATGLYIYKIKAGEFESRKKMLILK